MEDEPFIRAILAAPEDDLPRLVYADHLDETGRTDRAEFIRAQIESARLPPGTRRDQLAAREKQLREVNRWDWANGRLALFIIWKRGFEYELRPCTRGVFNGETSLSEFARHPLAEELELGICCTDEEFCHMPDLPNLRRFQFGGNAFLSDASVPRLARWGTLRRLEMQSRSITDAGLPHLAPLVGLTSLDLSYTQVTDDGLRHLTALSAREELKL